MKKFLYLLLLSLFVFTSCEQEQEIIDVSTTTDIANKKPVKIPVCHYNQGNDTWKTIYVIEKQLQKYLDNGDKRGPCGYTYVPDDGFEQILINNGWDDILDDYVLTSNITGVTNIGIDGYLDGVWIYNLIGIEDFTGLTSLIINRAGIKTLDLSNNSALVILRIDHINLLENLILPDEDSSLDRILSTRPAFCPLKSIDLSTSPLLTEVVIKFSQMSQIDFSQNPILNHLMVEGNFDFVNLKNGNNKLMLNPFPMSMFGSEACIQVDDAIWADENWNNVDQWSWNNFSEDCGY